MKKTITTITFLALLLAGCVSCEKGDGGKKLPVASISADKEFDAENKAVLTISLSKPSEEDVTVTLAKADAQPGRKFVPAHFKKTVVLKAGQQSATVEAEADILGIEDGEYQTAIAIASAVGAEVCDNPVVYIGLSFIYKPAVNLFADEAVAPDLTAMLKVVLEKASSVGITVTLKDGDAPQFKFNYEKNVRFEPGETEKEVVLRAEVPENLAAGKYQASIEIESVTQAVPGPKNSVSVSLVWPVPREIAIDGKFADWDSPAISSWTLGTGKYIYKMVKELKLTANARSVYLYFKFDDPSENGSKGNFLNSTIPTDIYVDADGNPATGCVVFSIDNDTAIPPYDKKCQGLEYYIELALHDVDPEGGPGRFNDFHSWGGVYKYGGKDGESVFSGLTNLSGTYDQTALVGAGEFKDGIGRVEVQMNRKWFGMTSEKARFAVKLMDMYDNWRVLGLLPQEALVGQERPLGDMASVILPPYEE